MSSKTSNHRLFKEILRDDVKLGYLLAFSESQYCSENIKFIMYYKDFKDLFEYDFQNNNHPALPSREGSSNGSQKSSSQGFSSSRHSNFSLDGFDGARFDQLKWNEIERKMNIIWEKFLLPKSNYEICISSDALENTKRRSINYRSYGPNVFEEAAADPIKTIVKDILPRFMQSNLFEEMNRKVEKNEGASAGELIEYHASSDGQNRFANRRCAFLCVVA